MLKSGLFLLLILCSASTLSAQLPDSCSAPTLVRHHYLASAKILALRQMLGDPAWADSVEIPPVLYNPILEALSAVYNDHQYAERDTVTDCLNILALPRPISPISLTLTADTNVLWAKKLFLGVSPTGNATIDDLLARYHLQKTGNSQLGKFFFFFETPDLLNTAALAALFNTVPDAHADPDGFAGDGNNIVLDTVPGGVSLRYSVAWGDCPSGCIFNRTWTFSVKPDCSVQFLGVMGAPLTAEVPCTSIFGCATEPLCMSWLQDSLQHYVAQYPDCQLAEPTINVTLYRDFNTSPVLGIHVFIGVDAEFTDFFYCSGDYIGTCQITIGGPGCTPEYLADYQRGDTIWTCDQPLPTPDNCGLIATRTPVKNTLSFQLSPNPVSTGPVSLKADFGERMRGRWSVFDVLGKTILEKSFDTAQLDESLDLVDQKPGLYFVRVDTGTRTGVRKLLVIP